MLFRDIFPQVFWAGDDSTQGGLYNSYQFLKTTEVFFRFVTALMGKGGWLGSPWLPRTPVGGSNPCQPRGLGLPSQTQLRGQSSRTEHSSHALPGTPSGDQEAHLESRLKEGGESMPTEDECHLVTPRPQVCWEQRPKPRAPAACSRAEHLCLRVRTSWGQWDTHQVATC